MRFHLRHKAGNHNKPPVLIQYKDTKYFISHDSCIVSVFVPSGAKLQERRISKGKAYFPFLSAFPAVF